MAPSNNPSPPTPKITARIAGRKPILVTLAKKGDRVFWCACGRSKTQPFCDGSHKGTGIAPVPYVAKTDNEEALLCACKRTRTAPFCDGAHNALSDGYALADEDEIAASAAIAATPRDRGAAGKALLDGGAFALTPDPADAEERAGWRIKTVIDRAAGARFIAQYLLEAGADAAPMSFPQSEAVIFILSGEGEAVIGERRFPVAPECALAVRPGEHFRLEASGAGPIRAAATVSPQPDDIVFGAGAPDRFDAAYPARCGRASADDRRAMGDRFYQVLADPKTGALNTTQFIGEIPKSRAAAHRHLYEEAIVILSGEGFLWTERARAAVKPGDILFLPRKQLHSLECVSDSGMRLAGAFYPSGSPAINY